MHCAGATFHEIYRAVVGLRPSLMKSCQILERFRHKLKSFNISFFGKWISLKSSIPRETRVDFKDFNISCNVRRTPTRSASEEVWLSGPVGQDYYPARASRLARHFAFSILHFSFYIETNGE